MLIVLIISIILQFFAAGFAFIRIRKSKRTAAWVLMSLALFLMAIRRSISLYNIMSSEIISIDAGAEIVALVISILMTAGVWSIGGLFDEINSLRAGAEKDLEKRINAENELKRQNTLLQQMGTVAKVGAWELDPVSLDGVWTNEVARIHDLPFNEDNFLQPGVGLLKGKQYYERSSQTILDEALKKALNEGSSYDLELELISEKGIHKWVRTIAHPVIEKGKTILLRGVIQDITEYRRARQQIDRITQRQEQLADIIEKSDQPVGFGYPDGRLGMCNPAFSKLTGYDMEELKKVNWNSVLTPPEYALQEEQALKELEKTGRPVRYQKEYIHKDGHRIPIELFAHIKKDQNGEVLFYYAFITDITMRKKAEEELARYRDHLEELVKARTEELQDLHELSNLILQTAPVGIVTYDSDGRCVRTNSRAAEMHGLSEKQMLNESLSESEFWKQSGMIETAYECLSSGIDQQHTVSFNSSSRRKATIDMKLSRFFVKQKPHLLATYSDITERVRSENAIKEFSRQLEVTNQELEAFSYSVSHDLRAPLRSIDGFSQALLEDYEDKLDDEGKDDLYRIRRAAQRMGQLIEDLLQLSRISRWKHDARTLDLGKMARQTIRILKESQPKRAVEVTIEDDLNVVADPRLMRLVIENLLSNAWKFSRDEKKATIEFRKVRNRDLDTPNPDLKDDTEVFFIRDNGAGFDMAYSDKLFGAFQRMHSLSEFEGTGIGLAIVKRAIQREGGLIWAEGYVKKGATLYFSMGTGGSVEELSNMDKRR
ncbi:MAG: PAS domain S-box protein [Sphaerochaetaceae bacterium]|nr:PAS domain S-box protein [Sphaerochaetaceae bacterium]